MQVNPEPYFAYHMYDMMNESTMLSRSFNSVVMHSRNAELETHILKKAHDGWQFFFFESQLAIIDVMHISLMGIINTIIQIIIFHL